MADLGTYLCIYIPFVILVALWVHWERKSVSEGNKGKKDLTAAIYKQNQLLQLLIERIDKLIVYFGEQK